MRKYFRTWQDWVIGIGGFILAPSLVPMILAGTPPPITSAGPTAAVLWAFTIAFGTLKLPLSTVSTALTSMMWTILAIQGLQALGGA